MLAEEGTKGKPKVYDLVAVRVNTGTDIPPEAWVKIKHKKEALEAKSSGDGPIDACFKAIDKITGVKARLNDYRLEAVTSGKRRFGRSFLETGRKE